MQQIEWSKAPDGTTDARQDEYWFYFYKDVTALGCKFFQVHKTNSNQCSDSWQELWSRPDPDNLIKRPFKGVDRLLVIATMKKRPIDSWSAGDCAVLPSGWAWVPAYGKHPHYDTLVRSSDGTIVNFTDVYGMASIFAPLVPVPIQPPMSNREYNDASGLSARLTLERLGYEWKGGELWKPPIGKTPDHIEYEGWNVGDECWVYDVPCKILSLYTDDNKYKFCVIEDGKGVHQTLMVRELKRPIVKCNFEHGKNVYLKRAKICVGRYIGVDPDDGNVVTIDDGKFRSYQLNQVTQ